MKINFDKLTQRLADLEKNAEKVDELVRNIRVEINELFWEHIASRKNNDTVTAYDLHD